MTINFLLQTTRILNVGNYSEKDLETVFKFVISVDNEVINHYLNSKSILAYSSDLELYLEILEELIIIYIEREEYEKCELLKTKKEESIIYLK